MNATIKAVSRFLVLSLLGFLLLSVGTQAASSPNDVAPEEEQSEVIVSEPVTPAISSAVRDLPPAKVQAILNREINPRKNPRLLEPDQGRRGSNTKEIDPLVQRGSNRGQTPDPILNFDGLSMAGYVPPDTVGDVGPNHYVQMVNVQFAIYNKSGTQVQGPTDINQLWQGQGGNCQSNNDGDPIVLYDPLANRWLLSQFSFPNHMCVAISQSADPTGSYYLYEFNVGSFPDYFKFGVWPDGYYMSANEGGSAAYTAYAFDRNSMLNGQAATFQKVEGQTNLLLPSDLDGATAPPNDSPNYFYTFKDDSAHGGSDRIEVFAFDVDWNNTSNSSFSLLATIPIATFNYTVCESFNFSCIPQPSPGESIDALSEWPMWRLQYRNFGAHETLVGNFTVDTNGSDHAGIRWFELRKSGSGNWTLHQEGTHAPDNHHRWLGSIAMDRDGNIGMGYSVSSSSLNPGIRYVTRLANDPLGTLQSEATLVDGGGVQTDGGSRWGDYSSLNVDPSDDCTFWYTTEYYQSTSEGDWQTRIGTFKIASCGEGGSETPTPTSTSTGNTATPTATSVPSTATATPVATATATPVASTTPIATATATIDPENGGTVGSDDGDVVFDFPGGAVDNTTTVIYSEQGEPSQSTGQFNFAGTSFSVEAFDENNDPVETFNEDFTLTVHYEDEDWMNAGIKSEDDLSLFYWDGSQWVDLMPCDGCSHDIEKNTLTIMLDHLTEFALLGETSTPTATSVPGTATATSVPGTATPVATATATATSTPVATVTATIDPDEGGTVTSDDGDVMLDFPAGVVTNTTTVIYSEQGEPSQSTGLFNFAGTSFRVDAFDENNNPVETFNEPFTLTVQYEDEDWMNAGIKSEDDLSLFYWDGSQWVDLMPCDGCSHDKVHNTLTIMLDHLTEFALLEDRGMSNQLYLPLINR